MDDILKWLMGWFSNQCNGEWEHWDGVRIESLDNPGWMIKIDLVDTLLEGKIFSQIKVDRSEHDWFICRIEEEGYFFGAGGPKNLEEMLKVFKDWATMHTKL